MISKVTNTLETLGDANHTHIDLCTGLRTTDVNQVTLYTLYGPQKL